MGLPVLFLENRFSAGPGDVIINKNVRGKCYCVAAGNYRSATLFPIHKLFPPTVAQKIKEC